MEWLEVSKTYIEIGILGLCAILTVSIAWLSFKRGNQKSDEKDKRIDKKDDIYVQDKHNLEDKFNTMIELLQKQNLEYQEQQAKNTELLIQSIIQGVTSHVPSPEENNKLTKISNEIDHILQQILIETGASRVSLVQYHNGGKGINKQSFLKMSITNEQVQLGVKPFMSDFKDQFRNVLAYFVKELDSKGFCYIEDCGLLKTVDTSMYEFLTSRDIQAKFGIAVHDINHNVIGFICSEYLDKTKVDTKIIDKSFNDKKQIIETLLNL